MQLKKIQSRFLTSCTCYGPRSWWWELDALILSHGGRTQRVYCQTPQKLWHENRPFLLFHLQARRRIRKFNDNNTEPVDPWIFWFSAYPAWYEIFVFWGRQKFWVSTSIAVSRGKFKTLIYVKSQLKLVGIVMTPKRSSIKFGKWRNIGYRKNNYTFCTLPMSVFLTITAKKNFKIPQVNVAFLVTDVQNEVPTVFWSPAVKARQVMTLKPIASAAFKKMPAILEYQYCEWCSITQKHEGHAGNQ